MGRTNAARRVGKSLEKSVNTGFLVRNILQFSPTFLAY